MRKRFCFACGLLVSLLLFAGPAVASGPAVGDPAPGFELPSLDGEQVTLTDFRGKLVVLHFGAGW